MLPATSFLRICAKQRDVLEPSKDESSREIQRGLHSMEQPTGHPFASTASLVRLRMLSRAGRNGDNWPCPTPVSLPSSLFFSIPLLAVQEVTTKMTTATTDSEVILELSILRVIKMVTRSEIMRVSTTAIIYRS
ncbi:hypothetical protein OIU78_029720 [Salix suchowensis]|nr:hypothetical protein OIU78_029720 [Salix suchowensis]